MTRAKGTVRTITYYNAETGYTVARLDVETTDDLAWPTGRPLPIVGEMPALSEGSGISVTGTMERHPTYGDQLRVTGCTFERPVTPEGLIRFLGSGLVKGVGPATARRIVKAWGVETLDILDRQPERLTEIQGIGAKAMQRIAESWRAQQSMRQLVIYLQEFGITPGMAQRIHNEMGHESIENLMRNPFLLCSMEGIGFRRADAIAAGLGIQGDRFERVEAAVFHVLNQAVSHGHAYLPCGELLEKVEALTEVLEERIFACLQRMRTAETVRMTATPGQAPEAPAWKLTTVYEPAAVDGAAQGMELLRAGEPAEPELDAQARQMPIYLPWAYQCESGLAQHLAQLLERRTRVTGLARSFDWARFFQRSAADAPLSASQRQAVRMALECPFGVLTGGPGTGKTTTIRTLIQLCRQLNLAVLLAAPTGRAAKRMQETTDTPASTLHRLLEVTFSHGRMEFMRSEKLPLEGDVLIVDEASMLDLPMAYHLMKAIPPSMHVLLVGDVDQLPSVGVGSVLKDVIRVIEERATPVKDRPTPGIVRLNEIFRQAADSAIVTNAHRVRMGEAPLIDNRRFRDFYFMEAHDTQRALRLCLELVHTRLPSHFGLKPRDIVILSPMRRGEIGVDNLNAALQEKLNPPRPERRALAKGETMFREGDVVMQIRNDHDNHVFNGDLGLLEQVNEEAREMRIRFDDRVVPYTHNQLSQITLAYAMTIHKSQGSEYPAVIIPFMKSHSIMLQRNLLYTALTRARQLVVVVGQREALAQAVRNAQVAQRHSALYETLTAKLHGLDRTAGSQKELL